MYVDLELDNGLEHDDFDRTEQETRSSTEVNDVSSDSCPPPKKPKGFTAILKNMEKEEGNTQPTPMTHEQQIENEISSYLDFPTAEVETSPLVWWKAEYRRFPTLSQLAKRYLCLPATSVPSEQVFSTCGHIVSSLRGRLLPKNVKKLIFCLKTCNNNYAYVLFDDNHDNHD